jgi:hypothetical protein
MSSRPSARIVAVRRILGAVSRRSIMSFWPSLACSSRRHRRAGNEELARLLGDHSSCFGVEQFLGSQSFDGAARRPAEVNDDAD